MTTNNQHLDAMLGGVTPYRIDQADGAVTAKAFDALYFTVAGQITTLTDSADANMLTASNITADTNDVEAGMFLRPVQGRTIKAVTLTSAGTAVAYGLTYATPSV